MSAGRPMPVATRIILRDALPEDEPTLLGWANDPEVRRASFNPDRIDATTHAGWYRGKLESADTAFFIGECDGRPVGYARVDRWSADVGEIAASIDASQRRQGLGRRLISLAAERGANQLGVRHIVARVKRENASSVRAFESAGFNRITGDGDYFTLVWPDRVFISHSRPFVGEAEAGAAAAVVRSRALAHGAIAGEVEADWCRRTGAAAAACVASGVGALRLGLWSLGVGPGDEVVVPAYSCVALLNAALVLGAKPVLADVLAGEWTLDPTDAASRITERTRAIIAVNLFGMPSRLAELREFGIPVVEDCAHGIGGVTDAGLFGGGGDVSIGSFYATKMIAGGEGGILAARDEELVERARAARDYGDQPPGPQKLNDKMTDVEAAIVREQLRRLPQMLSMRAERAGRYEQLLAPLAEAGLVELPVDAPGRIWYRYAALLTSGSGVEASERMAAHGVRAEQPVWDLRGGDCWAEGLEDSAKAFEQIVSLPLYPDLSEREQDYVAETFRGVLGA
jgi:perosamine synthetase